MGKNSGKPQQRKSNFGQFVWKTLKENHTQREKNCSPPVNPACDSLVVSRSNFKQRKYSDIYEIMETNKMYHTLAKLGSTFWKSVISTDKTLLFTSLWLYGIIFGFRCQLFVNMIHKLFYFIYINLIWRKKSHSESVL